jgi:predicted esterase
MLHRRATSHTLFLLLLLALVACGDRERPAAPPGGGSSGSGVIQTTSTTVTTTSGSSGAGGSEGPFPDAKDLPPVYGTCPKLESGRITFEVSGLVPRDVELRFSSKTSSLDGPLVILWHGDTQSPKAALDELLGSKLVTKVMAAGGVVAAPYRDTKAGSRVWYSSEGDPKTDDDFVILDQIVACTRAELGIDTRHIHVVGYQRGAFQAVHSAILRSGYIASAVVHSGGLAGEWAEQRTGLGYPFMIVHGGEMLDVTDQDYGASSVALGKLAFEGSPPFTVEHFTVLCDHGNGPTVAFDALPASYAFMMDTPFGTMTSPYGNDLGSDFPSYCVGQSP